MPVGMNIHVEGRVRYASTCGLTSRASSSVAVLWSSPHQVTVLGFRLSTRCDACIVSACGEMSMHRSMNLEFFVDHNRDQFAKCGDPRNAGRSSRRRK